MSDPHDDCRPARRGPGIDWEFRPAEAADAGWIAELRAVVMRPDLERLDRFDPLRVRQRFLDAYEPQNTRVILVDGDEVGAIAVRPADDGVWIEHFYLEPGFHGRGIGTSVLDAVLSADYAVPSGSSSSPEPSEAVSDPRFRLNVLQGSAARRLYERSGFALDSEDPVDVYLVGPRVSVAR